MNYRAVLLSLAIFAVWPSLSAADWSNDIGATNDPVCVLGDGSVLEKTLSISGTTFHDLSGSGFMDEGEPGLPGWTIRLVRDNIVIRNTTTDESGNYSFDNLEPGSYTLSEVLMEGWNQTAPGGRSYQVTLTDKCGYRYDFGNFEGAVPQISYEPPPFMYPTIEQIRQWIEAYESAPEAPINPEIAVQLEAAPTGSLSLLSHLQYTPVERNQGMCGNCWAWAGTGVLGIDLDVQMEIKDRLSIQYLNSNYNGGCGPNWACCGGWLSYLVNFYSSTDKAIPWSNTNAHWQDGNRRCADGSTNIPGGSISTTPDYPINTIQEQTLPTYGVGDATAIANIKNVLHQNKAVCFAFFMPTSAETSSFNNFWGYQPETTVWDPSFTRGKSWNNGAGHAVLCVGYDDTDPNNRYWIMLNSWGAPANRPNGLFRVDMDMDYGCYYNGSGYNYQAFFWQTLGVTYPSAGIWTSLGGCVCSLPNMIVDDQNRVHIFVVGCDGALWDNIDGTWYNLGGVLTSAPFAVKDKQGRIHVLARGGDYALWDLVFDTQAWTVGWYGLGGYITSMPSAVNYWGTDYLAIMVRGGDESLWTCDLYTPSMSLTWVPLAGHITSKPYVIEDASGNIHTLVRGGDYALWDHVIDSPGSFTWYGLGGHIESSASAVIEPGWSDYLAIMSRGGDDALWLKDLYTPGMTGTWRSFGGYITSAPHVISDSQGNIHTFVQGGDSSLWENVFSSSPWNPSGAQWHGHGGCILFNPVALANGYTHVAVLGCDSALWKNVFATILPSAAMAEESEGRIRGHENAETKDFQNIALWKDGSEVVHAVETPVEIVPMDVESATKKMSEQNAKLVEGAVELGLVNLEAKA